MSLIDELRSRQVGINEKVVALSLQRQAINAELQTEDARLAELDWMIGRLEAEPTHIALRGDEAARLPAAATNGAAAPAPAAAAGPRRNIRSEVEGLIIASGTVGISVAQLAECIKAPTKTSIDQAITFLGEHRRIIEREGQWYLKGQEPMVLTDAEREQELHRNPSEDSPGGVRSALFG